MYHPSSCLVNCQGKPPVRRLTIQVGILPPRSRPEVRDSGCGAAGETLYRQWNLLMSTARYPAAFPEFGLH